MSNNQIENNSIQLPDVCVVGLGFVGLTLGLVLSESGFKVLGVDKFKEVVDSINNKRPHFYEKGLVELLDSQLKNGFSCSVDINEAKDCGVYIIAVGTPVKEDNQPNFDDLENATKDIGKILKKGDLVILRSTVPIGVTRDFVIPILEKESGLSVKEDFYIAFAPERTVEGEAIQELKILPQIIGGYNKLSADKASTIFNSFTPNLVMVNSLEEAEMVKVVNNTYRDLVFAFANELSLICDVFNIDTGKVIEAANVGYSRSQVPKPSPGVGGYCLTKDPHLLSYSAKKHGSYVPVLPDAARRINSSMPEFVYKKIMSFLDKHCSDQENKDIAILGFAFKGNPPTSDVRFSPTLDLVKLLNQESGIRLFGHDFLIEEKVFSDLGVKFEENIENLFKDKSCVILMNNHPDYTNLPIDSLLSSINKPALFFDPWVIYDREQVEKKESIFYSNLGYSNF